MIPNDLYIWKLVAYFSINRRFCLISLGNPTFSNIFPRAKHVIMTFELWTLSARSSLFSLYISHRLLSSQQASVAMWTISISKSWCVVTETKTLTSILHHNIFTYLDYIFSATFIYIYIYIYERERYIHKQWE